MKGIQEAVNSEMVERYSRMLEPLNMYVENLIQMLEFQQYRFYNASGIRCRLLRDKKAVEPACHHVACPLCWHRATVAYLHDIYGAGSPPGLRLRVLPDVPPAVDHLAFVTEMTAGETPWVFDLRCEAGNPDMRRLVILSAIKAGPGLDQETESLCGSEAVPLVVHDFSTVKAALDEWFEEAPPPFTYPDYEQFMQTTKDYSFGECIHAFQIPPGYVTSSDVDDSLLRL
jgi:hypothetical protein